MEGAMRGGRNGETIAEPESTAKTDGAAFDDALSDLAYLQGKKDTSLETCVEDKDDDVDEKEKKKKNRKRKREEEHEETVTDKQPIAIPVEGQETVESSGRLYVTNLPYIASEDEVEEFFSRWGRVSSVKICYDEDTLRSRGICFVTFMFPEHALKVLSLLDLPEFQGRLLRIQAAMEQPEKEKTEAEQWNGWYKDGSSFKKKKAKRKKEVDAHLEQTWNLLYMSSATANTAMAAKLGIEKRKLIDKDEGNLAVTQAIAETQIINETKQWLEREGIHIDSFSRQGVSLATSVMPSTKVRRNDTIIVKHLPSNVDSNKLRDKFGCYGELMRCALAPSKTVAVIQFSSSENAKTAFTKLAFSRFLHVPLYLEWAPEEIFTGPTFTTSPSFTSGVSAADKKEEDKHEQEEAEQVVATIFVKNLSFKTTQERLRREFSNVKGFRKATVMMKKRATKDGKSEELSMGYGFLEFQTTHDVTEAIKKKQNCLIDGHSVKLQVSNAGGGRGAQQQPRKGGAEERTAKDGKVPTSNKLCVRNLAFEANKKELRALFSSFGTVTALRIPKKANGGHRGFAFLDFLTKQEAMTAYESLQHTHFYGRHLVIEPAEKDSETVEELLAKQQAMAEKKDMNSESKQRRRIAELETTSGSFSIKAI